MPHSIHKIHPEIFLNEDALSFYLLGVYMSDGNISKFNNLLKNRYIINLCSNDEDWVSAIKEKISPGRKLYAGATKNSFRLQFYSKEIWNWLNDHECTPKKSYTVKFPVIPEQFYPDLFRGLLDGDGCICLSKCKSTIRKGKYYTYNNLITYICTASKNLAIGMHEYLLKINIEHSMLEIDKSKYDSGNINGRILKNKTNMWKISFSGKKAIKFLKWLFYKNYCFSMPRKFKIFQKAIEIYDSDRESLSIKYDV